MSIGEIIKKYCREHGISYQQFASTCNVSKGYISMLVNGKNPKTGKPLRPTIETYQRLAEGMNMTLDELFEIMDDAPVRLNYNGKKAQSDVKPLTDVAIDRIKHRLQNMEAGVAVVRGRAKFDLDKEVELWQRRETLRRDPKRKVLFDLAENGTDRDIDAAVKLLDALRATNPDFYDGDDPS